MPPREHNTEVPVTKNADSEGPVPSAWRPIVHDIVDALVRHDYRLADGVTGVAPVSADTATQIREAIEDYGDSLLALPEETWDSAVCVWTGDRWDVLVDLWTEKEGSSDLVLQLRVEEGSGAYVMAVHMVYVP